MATAGRPAADCAELLKVAVATAAARIIQAITRQTSLFDQLNSDRPTMVISGSQESSVMRARLLLP